MLYKSLFIIGALLVQLLSWHGTGHAEDRKSGAGVLTGKPSYNSVVINGTTYWVDTNADMLDDRGKTLTFSALPIQARYYIEYEINSNGQRVIKLMKLLPE